MSVYTYSCGRCYGASPACPHCKGNPTPEDAITLMIPDHPEMPNEVWVGMLCGRFHFFTKLALRQEWEQAAGVKCQQYVPVEEP